jgi:hypothetical protein
MVRAQSTEEVVRERVRSSLETFLDGKKDLNWITGVIGKSGVGQRKRKLQEMFDELRLYENLPRYWEILEECKRKGWL